MRAAPELLGAPTIGGGSAQPGCGGGGSQKSQKAFQAANVQKQRRNGQFPALIDLKMPKTLFFT